MKFPQSLLSEMTNGDQGIKNKKFKVKASSRRIERKMNRKLVKSKAKGPKENSRKPISAQKRTMNKDDNQEKFERLAKTNPKFYETLVQNKVVDSANLGDEDEQDELDIKRYAKKLKLKEGKEIPSDFQEDGLDEILGLLNQFDKNEKVDSDMEEEFESDEDEDAEEEESNLQDFYSEDDDAEEEESNLQDLHSEEDLSEEDSESEQEEEVTVEEKKPAKYMPPSMRQRKDNSNQAAVQRKVQGILNKITESNIETICNSIDSLFLDHSRHDVNEAIKSVILKSVTDNSGLLDSFMIPYAVLISLVYNLHGVESVAKLLESLVEEFEKNYQELRATDNESLNKNASNLFSLLCYLYIFKVVSSNLVYDILHIFLKDIAEFDVELILKALKICGFSLRSDDPANLKKLIEDVHLKDTDNKSSRYKFMIESINDIKNNKRKKYLENDKIEVLLKFLRRFVNQKGSSLASPIGVSLSDIKSAEKKGKWWLVGGTWVGNDDDESVKASKARISKITNDANAKLLDMAKKQGMTTDIRKSIFIVLMTSQDFIEAYERILKLGLKDKQEREIIKVLIHCCGSEKCFNPYYAHLIKKFCDYGHSFKITAQYSFWDFFKDLKNSKSESVSLNKISNLSKLLSFLFAQSALPMTILKVVTFENLSHDQILFFQIMFTELFVKYGTDQAIIKSVFKKIASVADLFDLREGLVVFFTQFLKQNNPFSSKNPELLRQNIKLSKSVLESGNAKMFE